MALSLVVRSRLRYLAVFAVGVLIVLFGVAAQHLYAQQAGNGFSVSPTRITIDDVDPGETVSREVSIQNVTQTDATVEVFVRDFVPSDNETGQPTILYEQGQPTDYSLSNLVQSIDNFSLAAGETRQVTVNFDVPTNATPGGHYGVVLFRADIPRNTDDQVGLSASVGPLVLLEVNGELATDLELLEISAATDADNDDSTPPETGSFFVGGPLSIVTRLQNTGNTHLQPTGTITVKNMFGSVVDQFELNSPDGEVAERGYVLPDSVRRFEDQLSDKLYLGRYTIEGTISYVGGSGDFITVGDSFWVVPVWAMAGAIAVIALIVLMPKLIRVYNQRVIDRARDN